MNIIAPLFFPWGNVPRKTVAQESSQSQGQIQGNGYNLLIKVTLSWHGSSEHICLL